MSSTEIIRIVEKAYPVTDLQRGCAGKMYVLRRTRDTVSQKIRQYTQGLLTLNDLPQEVHAYLVPNI